MDNYLDILEDSLKKKKDLLDEIFESNERAKGIFTTTTGDTDVIDTYIEEKGRLIERLEELDEGFQTVYERVAEEISKNKNLYSDKIKRLQALVREVSAGTAKVQAQESRMKADFERYLEKQKSNIGEGRRNSKAAMAYYQNRTGIPGVDPLIMDSKK